MPAGFDVGAGRQGGGGENADGGHRRAGLTRLAGLQSGRGQEPLIRRLVVDSEVVPGVDPAFLGRRIGGELTGEFVCAVIVFGHTGDVDEDGPVPTFVGWLNASSGLTAFCDALSSNAPQSSINI